MRSNKWHVPWWESTAVGRIAALFPWARHALRTIATRVSAGRFVPDSGRSRVPRGWLLFGDFLRPACQTALSAADWYKKMNGSQVRQDGCRT